MRIEHQPRAVSSSRTLREVLRQSSFSGVPFLDDIPADLTFNFQQRLVWQGIVPAAIDTMLTATRATTPAYGRSASGLYVPYDANTIRYDDVLGGALIEEARTNLCLQSSALDSASWIKPADATVTADATTGIFGSATADMITCNGAGGGALYQLVTVAPSTTYTWSFFVKLGTMAAGSYKFAVYDNTNLAFIGANLVPSPAPTTTTWTRVTYTFTTPAGCVAVRVYVLRNGVSISGTAYVDQCQLEAGAFGTSPIPTTTAAVSRAGDIYICTLPVALQGLPAYTKAWEGLFFANTPSGNQFVTWLNDGTISNQIAFYKPVSNLPTVTRTPPGGGVASLSAVTPNSSLRLACAATDNDVAMLQTGQAARTATGAGFPVGINKLNVGSYNGGSFLQNGVCKSAALWGSRRTNAAMAGWVG